MSGEGAINQLCFITTSGRKFGPYGHVYDQDNEQVELELSYHDDLEVHVALTSDVYNMITKITKKSSITKNTRKRSHN